jgi:hypothetical protein
MGGTPASSLRNRVGFCLPPVSVVSLLTRARIRAPLRRRDYLGLGPPFDGEIISLKTARPLPSRWSPLSADEQLEDGRTLADYNI